MDVFIWNMYLIFKELIELIKSLRNYATFFNGSTRIWDMEPLYFKLKDDTKPVCSRAYQVPMVHGTMFNFFEYISDLGVPKR